MTETGHHANLPSSFAALAYGGLLAAYVTPKQQAGLIASVALWSLRERGLIELSAWECQRWWWPWSPESMLMVKTMEDEEIGLSIEQQLVTEVRSIAITPHKGPNSKVRVRDVIYKWLGDDYPDPYRELIRRVEQLATTTGWYEVVQVRRGSPVTRFVLGPKAVPVPSPTRADALKHSAESLAGDWYRFRHDEYDLSSWLIDTVTDAIGRRMYNPPD